MTPTTLKQWRERMNLNKTEAALALGLSPNGYHAYETGWSRIPRYVALACSAIAMNLPPYGDVLPEVTGPSPENQISER